VLADGEIDEEIVDFAENLDSDHLTVLKDLQTLQNSVHFLLQYHAQAFLLLKTDLKASF